MAIPNTYTPQQLEDVRKKMHLSRSRLDNALPHPRRMGSFNPS